MPKRFSSTGPASQGLGTAPGSSGPPLPLKRSNAPRIIESRTEADSATVSKVVVDAQSPSDTPRVPT